MGPQLKLGSLFNRLSYLLNRLYPMSEHKVISAWHREALWGQSPEALPKFFETEWEAAAYTLLL